ncbi:MAG: basic amino acid ABC transporter substrate-binding protein [Candidatus Brocadiae bacterium]|nr:basic amino acid ABC transporter substrate-binding protein [Candidatus Brocadiia bacterium]
MRLLLALLLVPAALLLAGCSGATPPGSGPLKVGTDASYRPFEFLEGADKFAGFDIELMQAVGREIGRPVEFRNSPFDGLIPGLKAGHFDVAISCLTITPKRAEEVAFSDPYYEAGQIVAVRHDEAGIRGREDLRGRPVGAQEGTTGLDEAKALGATVRAYGTIDLAFQDLANGQIDAIVNDEPVSRWLVARKPGFKLVGELFTREQYGIATAKGNGELIGKINEALKKIRASGEWERIREKWITKPQ